MNKLSKKKDLELLGNHTPVFGVIATADDSKKSWVEAGKTYQAVALAAEQQDLKTAPMAAIIQIGDFYKDLQKAAHTQFRPQVFFRLGHCNNTSPHSPRLSAETVTAAQP